MALLQRLRRLVLGPPSASTVGTRRPSSAPRPEASAEDRLRAKLVDDPNDARSFAALVEVVRRRATETPEEDPLSAPTEPEERRRAGDLAVWSLAEELAGNPKAWFPLIELARLSVDDDREGALRRLATAAERDPSGKALAEGMSVLREAGLPVEALGLGVGHWRVREQDPAVGRQLVLAALEAERPAEARHHLDSLRLHPDDATVEALREELEPAIERAERRTAE
ncbi:hypothetical protein Q6348_12720 [Isoptericola sp. b441]|uniref:Tetratricopeptide repeat protein n=1 Tax=Actinotalea lenta TaxID=3064654 RepID=A0ABT9DAY7_9CELL|nr:MULTISPECIES: hypothetical protein [unclassified Isoptericola]MDO8108059.1 hypothetical protein [Isoptericola sp. b441]MDO8120272.1 hypothetical protein [Isoptericola sp. b490]